MFPVCQLCLVLPCLALMSLLNTIICVYVLVCVSLFFPAVCTVTHRYYWHSIKTDTITKYQILYLKHCMYSITLKIQFSNSGTVHLHHFSCLRTFCSVLCCILWIYPQRIFRQQKHNGEKYIAICKTQLLLQNVATTFTHHPLC